MQEGHALIVLQSIRTSTIARIILQGRTLTINCAPVVRAIGAMVQAIHKLGLKDCP